jgi:hypothetical protein
MSWSRQNTDISTLRNRSMACCQFRTDILLSQFGSYTFSAFVVMIRNSPFGKRLLQNWYKMSQVSFICSFSCRWESYFCDFVLMRFVSYLGFMSRRKFSNESKHILLARFGSAGYMVRVGTNTLRDVSTRSCQIRDEVQR